ncbi:MAG: amidase [Lautropia sp.]
MSCVERVERQLEACDRWNPELKALITVGDRAALLDQAYAADRAWNDGRWSGLLAGTTIVLKDNLDTAGLATTAGAAFLRDRVPAHDATVVARLRAAGALLLGKANMTELAFGAHSRSAVGGQCRNPWDRARIPGGSSGGSAAALAAGFCDVALGTDTGGSIRTPAAFNGVCGLRPTQGLVSNHGTWPVCAAHDTTGPMARRVEDLARLFTVIAGADPADGDTAGAQPSDVLTGLAEGIAGLRIGVPSNHYFDGCSDDIAERVRAALAVLEQAGAKLVPLTVPDVAAAPEMLTRLIISEVCRRNRDRLEREPDSISPEIRERMSKGFGYSALDLVEAVEFRRRWRNGLGALYADIDLLAAPAAPVAPPLIDDMKSLFETTKALAGNTFPSALGGQPSLSVPCGFDRAGLPVGLLLDAPPRQEARLLRAGYALQQRTDWHRQAPAL